MVVDRNVTGRWPFAVGLVGFALAVVVCRARPDRWQDRKLDVQRGTLHDVVQDGELAEREREILGRREAST